MNDTAIEVFVDDYGGVEGVAVVMREPSIVEYEGEELTPGCKLTAAQALTLAGALIEAARQIEI